MIDSCVGVARVPHRGTQTSMRNMVGLRWATPISSVMVLVGLFTIPPVVLASSGGGVTCSFDEGTHTVTVTIDQVFFFGGLTNANGEIRLTAGSQPATDCGTSTMTNTDTVLINDVTPPPGPGGGLASSSIDIIPDGGAWGPGFSDEPGVSDEIEFAINLGAPGPEVEGDTVGFDGSASPVGSTVVLAADQVNLNADEEDGVDADVVLNGVEGFEFRGSRFNDSVDASGGTGTPAAPYGGEFLASGQGGNDAFTAGTRGVSFFGGEGNDALVGSARYDFLVGGSGKDVVRGASGNDGLVGGPGRDFLLGGSGRDTGWGVGGNDRLRGQADSDDLLGGADDDRLEGGPGRDGCKGGPGTNALKSCERETRH
jgi:Ca2+-binding RTX toxin-like protein